VVFHSQANESNFGITFDFEGRYSQLLDQIGSVEIDPVISVFTPGIGLISGDPEIGQLRFGVRPEIILSPQNEDDAFGNELDFQWVIPEFLIEYQIEKTTLGASYKVYNLSIQSGTVDNEIDLSTISAYIKYYPLVAGYNFVDVEQEGFDELFVEEGDSWFLGLALQF